MIISTKKGTPKEELEKIVDKFEKQGLDVTLITGKDYNVFGLVGDTTKIDERDVLANPWIDNVTRVSAPYKRANRLFHPADSVIDCGVEQAVSTLIGRRHGCQAWSSCRAFPALSRRIGRIRERASARSISGRHQARPSLQSDARRC